MAVCEKCNLAYSHLESNIHRLQNNIREKEKLIDGFISVALAQSKLISYMESSRALSLLLPGSTGGGLGCDGT